jgi:methylglutaconyl-CoA hydratase
MLSGEEFDAAEAFRIGLVHDIREAEDLNSTVGRMLAQLYAGGPNALAAVKRLIPEVAASRLDDALAEKTAERLADVRATAEAQEGLSAFLEKRKARWTEPAARAKAPRKRIR